MKHTYLVAAAVSLLVLLNLLGIASAGSPDATVKDIYWNAGNQGFLMGDSFTLGLYDLVCNVPGSDYVEYNAPLTIPTQLRGKPCSVSRIYLHWNALQVHRISTVRVYTPGTSSPLVTLHPDIYGTESDQLVSLDLGGNYPVVRGLVMVFTVNNEQMLLMSCNFNGYGAMIKHAA